MGATRCGQRARRQRSLGDLGFVQGTHFDLNEHNVRYCVTPEFPGGTWAYFVCIDSNGAPAFPYNIGRQYWGAGTGPGAGGAVASIAEPVAVHFSGGPRMPTDAGAPVLDAATGDVTLVWSAVDGGTYTIEASTNLTAWPPVRTNLPPSVQSSFPAPSVYRSQVMTNAAAGSSSGFYRMRRVATNAFDNAGFAP